MNTKLILVGGFLGAGKTTLLAHAARTLREQGKRVGLITNDQAPELVDTALLSSNYKSVAEVSGSCFCCNFPGLLGAITKLKTVANANVIIAEPVGSCTDLSATIVQPLRDLHRSEVLVAPLSVAADPCQLNDILNGGTGGLHPSAAYIYRKQLEEADFIVINKADLLSAPEMEDLKLLTVRRFPLVTVFALSAKTGEGMDPWLNQVMAREDAGKRLAEVDYDIYAEGEAVLGWLNGTMDLSGSSVDWREFLSDLLLGLKDRFSPAAIGHVKLLVAGSEDTLVANLTGGGEAVSVRGPSFTSPNVKLTINARVEMSPEDVDRIVRDAVSSVAAKSGVSAEQVAWRFLSPGRPTPTYRYEQLVSLI